MTLAFLAIMLMSVENVSAQPSHSVLYSFTGGSDGGTPWASLLIDPSGNLYGTTYAGGISSTCDTGTSGCGVVFELSPAQDGMWTEHVLYDFAGGSDGSNPQAGLTLDAAGNFYGTTYFGGGGRGSDGNGTVFELSPGNGGWQEKVLYRFTGSRDGGLPSGNLLLDKSGNLYGVTLGGGASGFGTVFELAHKKGAWTEKVLYSFTGGADGGFPLGNLIFDSAGNLYGNTDVAGAHKSGSVFELVHKNGTWSFSLLSSLGGVYGNGPYSGLAVGKGGSLYSTACCGGAKPHDGTVFRLALVKGKWKTQLVHAFQGGNGDGAYPHAGLVFDSSGNFYGSTSGGGASNAGTVFMFVSTQNGYTENLLWTFNGADGQYPDANVILDGDGNLYGTTFGGGANGQGTVFEVTP